LTFNLTDTLSRQTELLTDLFKRITATVMEAKSHPQNPDFPRVQSRKHFLDAIPKHTLISSIRRRRRLIVLNEVA
jgi:hypothetical protein